MADTYILIKLENVSPESSIPENVEHTITSVLELLSPDVQWYTNSIHTASWIVGDVPPEDIELVEQFKILNTFNF
jgi:hypothetical protein